MKFHTTNRVRKGMHRPARTLVTASVSLVMLLGCGPAPGTPLMMSKTAEPDLLLPACQNVDPTSKSSDFISNFYLTTYDSAFSEGAEVGLREGLGRRPTGVSALLAAALQEPISVDGQQLITKKDPLEPFCMIIHAPISRVQEALPVVYSDLKNYGYTYSLPDPQYEIFQTAFKPNGHRAAKWYDRLSTSADALDPNRTGVYVLREVFISRSESPYVQATSVGANEAWLLTRIRDLSTR